MVASETNTTSRSLMQQPSSIHSLLARPAPFDRLAAETVEQIFISACPSVNLPLCSLYVRLPGFPNSETTDPSVLSMVCRRWYNITKTYHSLWKTIDIWMFRVKPGFWEKWGFLQLRNCLNRSGNHSLTIRMHELGSWPYDSQAVSEILKLVMLHSERWNRVEFNFELIYEFLEDLGFFKRRFPRLESLKIHFDRYGLDKIIPATKGGILRDAPLLTRICLGRTTNLMSVLQIIPWTQFSEVVLDSCSFEQPRDLVKTLKCMSATVTSLKLHSIEINSIPIIPSPEEPITLVKLRRLYVLDVYPLVQTLNALSCPSLERLEIGYASEEDVAQFLNNSSRSLKHLRLYISDLGRYQQEHWAILKNPALVALKSLYLEDLTDSQQLFPSLETLCVDVKIIWDPYDTEYAGSKLFRLAQGLQEIVKSRTQATALKQRELATPIEFPQPGRSCDDVRFALKNYSFTFRLQRGEDETSTSEYESDTSEDECYWDMEPLEELRSFCLSRNIRGHQEVFYI